MYPSKEFGFVDLGLIDYEKACVFQKDVVRQVIEGSKPPTLIICQHPHVITFTRLSKEDNFLISREELKNKNVSVCLADRGGDLTYHGPGQIIFYPIVDLREYKKDVHFYLRMLEEVVIRTLKDNFGLNAHRKPDLTGVWVGPYKVSSIGVGVRHWVTYHGFSLNVNIDKSYLSFIRSCGMDMAMASINDFFDDEVSLADLKSMLIEKFEEVFDCEIRGGIKKW